MAYTICEITWIHALLNDLHQHHPQWPTLIFCDNQATLHIATNPVYHKRTEYIELDSHLMHGKLQEGSLTTLHACFISSSHC